MMMMMMTMMMMMMMMMMMQAGIDNNIIFLSKSIYFIAMVLGEEPAGEEQVRILAHDALQKNRLLK
eukprot:2807907-Karenia_brevis.AAC.1